MRSVSSSAPDSRSSRTGWSRWSRGMVGQLAGQPADAARARDVCRAAHARLGGARAAIRNMPTNSTPSSRRSASDRRVAGRDAAASTTAKEITMIDEATSTRQCRLLPGLRARRHRPRLQPLDQGSRQGARPRTRRVKNWNCCGAMEVKNIDPKMQTYLSSRVIVDRGQRDGHRDVVMAPCNGCYHNLKKAEYDLAQRSRHSREVVDRLSRKAGHTAYQAGQGRDHPCARLDQAGDRRGRPSRRGSRIRSRG